MYRFTRSLGSREIFAEQLPIAAVSFVVAELVYKFHSFTLECLAFLATWYVFDIVVGVVFRRQSHTERNSPETSRS